MHYIKFFIALCYFIFSSHNAFSFDLKSLTDKLQKDLGNKLQVPKGGNNSGNSNPLGGMLKNLNKNKGGGSALNLGNMSQASSSNTGSGAAKPSGQQQSYAPNNNRFAKGQGSAYNKTNYNY